MQLPFEEQNLTVEEAADVLNVRRERIWKLMNDGVLTAEPSKLDGRQRLIPREQVEGLLLQEGYRPRRAVQRRTPDESQSDSGDAIGATSCPWPRSIGMVSDGTLPGSESEVYLRKQLHGDLIEVE
jgi:excisionase family DNA binding protein